MPPRTAFQRYRQLAGPGASAGEQGQWRSRIQAVAATPLISAHRCSVPRCRSRPGNATAAGLACCGGSDTSRMGRACSARAHGCCWSRCETPRLEVLRRKRHVLTGGPGGPAAGGKAEFPFIERLIGDAGYQGPKMAATAARVGAWMLATVRRCGRHCFVAPPKRWIVERTLAWTSQCRGLARGYERHACEAAAFVRLAMTRVMLRRLAASTSNEGSGDGLGFMPGPLPARSDVFLSAARATAGSRQRTKARQTRQPYAPSRQ